MLVLRRRAQEAIVFEGGLTITLTDIVDHRAWLAFGAPAIPQPVAVATLGVGPDGICLGIRSPREVRHSGGTTSVALERVEPGAADTVLLVNKRLGERLAFEGIDLDVSSLDQGRAVLSASVVGMSGPVGVSVFSVSGAEVKIGIAAPDDVRVYREEVWLAMRSANQGAAVWSPADLESLTGSPLELRGLGAD